MNGFPPGIIFRVPIIFQVTYGHNVASNVDASVILKKINSFPPGIIVRAPYGHNGADGARRGRQCDF